MRYLKTYEDFTDKPKIGDYVICKIQKPNYRIFSDRINIINFMNNNIGKIIKISNGIILNYGVHYENIPNNILGNFNYENDNSRWVNIKELAYWSSDKEHIISIQHLIQDTNKYNL